MELEDKYYDEGENYYIKSDYENALRLFKKSYDIRESNDVLNYIGCCYINLDRDQSAIVIFEKLIELNPNWERPYFNLGRVYLKNTEMDKALEYFEKAISINPYNEDAQFYLGVYYYSIGDYEKAKEYHEKSIQLDDNQPETHLSMGKCYYHLKEYEKAIIEFHYAYTLNNRCYDAIYNKAQTYLTMRNYQEALSNFLEYNNYHGDDVENLFNIAYCNFRLDYLNIAREWLNKILDIDSTHENAISLLEHINNKSEVIRLDSESTAAKNHQ